MVEHEDEAIHRMRAGDPATGSHPDLHRLRELIAHKAPASQGADRATAVDDELLRGPRLRAPWIAAAAVAALAVGAGGYALGTQQPGTSPAADGAQHQAGAAAPGTDDSGEPSDGAGTDDSDDAGTEDSSGWADAEADADMGIAAGHTAEGEESYTDMGGGMGGDAAGSGPAWDPGPVRLTAGEGLPGSPGTAEVRVVQSEQTPQEFLDAWTAETGFEGLPVPESDYFFGPDYPGTASLDVDAGVMVMVSNDGGALHFSYDDIYGNEYCSEMYTGVADEDLQLIKEDWARGYGPDLPFPTPENCDEITGEAPSEEQAKAVASNFFEQAGLDVAAYTFTTYAEGDPSKMVMVDAELSDGAGTGDLLLSATVGPDGVVTAYGSIGELATLGEYPVISAADAVERYGSREFSLEYGVSIADDYATWTEEDWEDVQMPEYTLPEKQPLQPGDKIPMLLKDKVVTGAELVRGTMWTEGAGSIEVPVWKLTTTDGMYYPVLALAEEAIEFQSWE